MPGRCLTRLVPLSSLVLLLLVVAAPASAQYALLGIEGEPLVGATLRAEVTGSVPGYQWQRRPAGSDAWQAIPGATSDRYTVTRADEGHHLRVRAGSVFSAETEVVRAAPVADVAPSWSGTAREGETLTGDPGTWYGTAPLTLASTWLRCNAGGAGCTPITGTTGAPYTLTVADVGHAIRIGTYGGNAVGLAYAESEPTGPVLAADAPEPKRISPFPIIRVAGRVVGRRTRFTLVRVRAPSGARIAVRCRGRRCPYRSRATISRRTRLRALERSFPPGTTIEFRVTLSGHIGKYTKLRIRRGARPARVDRCLPPGSRAPVRCGAL